MGSSLVVEWLRLHLPMLRVPVQSLVGKLRCHMPHGQKPNPTKKPFYKTEAVLLINSTLKMVHIKKT